MASEFTCDICFRPEGITFLSQTEVLEPRAVLEKNNFFEGDAKEAGLAKRWRAACVAAGRVNLEAEALSGTGGAQLAYSNTTDSRR